MKQILLAATAVIFVTGCMATTGGEESATASSSAAAQTATASKSCADIQQEIAELQVVVDDGENASSGAHATNVGSAVAGHAVGLSGLPLVGSLIGHAGTAARMSAAEREEAAREAQLEINTLSGVYAGKGCGAPSNIAATKSDIETASGNESE